MPPTSHTSPSRVKVALRCGQASIYDRVPAPAATPNERAPHDPRLGVLSQTIASANPYQTLLYQHAGRDLYPRCGTIAEALALHRQRGVRRAGDLPPALGGRGLPQRADRGAAWQAAQRFLGELETFLEAAARWSGPCTTRRRTTAATSRCTGSCAAKLAQLADVVHVHSLAGLPFARRRSGSIAGQTGPDSSTATMSATIPGWAIRWPSSRAGAGPGRGARACCCCSAGWGATRAGPNCWTALRRARRSGSMAGDRRQADRPAGAACWASCRPRSATGSWCWTVHRARAGAAAVPCRDMAVLPYRASLTSGTALLALSQARPVLAPAFPRPGRAADRRRATRCCTRQQAPRWAARPPCSGCRPSTPHGLAAMQTGGTGQGGAVRLAPAGLLLDGVYARSAGGAAAAARARCRCPASASRPNRRR